jgi:hypothetical protein
MVPDKLLLLKAVEELTVLRDYAVLLEKEAVAGSKKLEQ